MRVLVVEDDQTILTYLVRHLRHEGYAVDSASTGEEALDLARERTYDVMTLDILLPGINGYEVCRILREEGISTPILMLTAKDGDYDEADALDMVGITLKPVQTMRAEVASLCSQHLVGRLHVPKHDKDLAPLATTFNQLLERMEQAFNNQRRFMSEASHELKSPLAAAGVILESMRDQPQTYATSEVIDDLLAQNQRAADIVSDLLVLARQDENRIVVRTRPIDLADLLFEEIANLPRFDDVEIAVAGIEPLVAVADQDLLSHAMRNLLTNACRFAYTRVAVSCEEQGGNVVVRIADDGPGIAPEDRDRVFERFEQLQTNPRRGPAGTGLGLSVAQGVLEAQGGTVHFEDCELGGACAVVRLPQEDASNRDEQEQSF